MKPILFTLSLALTIALLSFDGSAQNRSRLRLPEGANSIEVTGKVKGKQYLLYEIFAEKGDEWSVDLDSTNQFIGYTVKDPKGDRYDFLERSPASGYYIIRVDLNSKGSKSTRPATFQLKIKFEMSPTTPIS